MDWSIIILALLVGNMIWACTFGECGLVWSKKQIMRKQRRHNPDMRPNWVYKLPNGITEMSPTGHRKDIIRGTYEISDCEIQRQ